MPELVYRPIVYTAKSMFRVLGIPITVTGAEYIPTTGGAVVAINHTSFLDFIFGGVPADERGGRLVRFMAKDAVFANPVAGPLMRGMKHIPVDRSAGADAYAAAVAALKAGELVGVFPEATMSRSFDIKDLKSGAARMAAEAGVPLIPEVVFGGQRIMSYDHRDLSRGTAVSVSVGEPLHPKPGDDMDAITAELSRRLQSLLDQAVAAYPQVPGDPAEAATTWWLPARLGGGAPTLAEAKVQEEQAKAAKAAKRAASGKD